MSVRRDRHYAQDETGVVVSHECVPYSDYAALGREHFELRVRHENERNRSDALQKKCAELERRVADLGTREVYIRFLQAEHRIRELERERGRLQECVDDSIDDKVALVAEKEKLQARIKELEDIIKYRVIGWREHDWPEGFDRRTAQLISDYVQEELLKGEDE